MRPRSICAWAALLTAACGSSSGNGLFSGGQGDQPVIGTEAGTDPSSGGGGKTLPGGGGSPGEGGQTQSTGGIAGATPKTGGSPGNGGAPGAGGTGGVAGEGGAESGGGSAGAPDTGGAAGSGGAGGDGAGGQMAGKGGSTAATPHSVACGATTCQVGSALMSACCVSPVQLATVCISTILTGCANGGAAVTCDDATDCVSGEICCADSVGNLPITVCAKSCNDGLDQLCRTKEECKQGRSCEPIDAQPQYSRCK
jgi:hypothetical protein